MTRYYITYQVMIPINLAPSGHHTVIGTLLTPVPELHLHPRGYSVTAHLSS